RPPPRRRGVTGRVRRAILAGLRPDPSERHASVDALIAELGHRSLRSRRGIAFVLVTTLMLGIGGGWIAWSSTAGASDPCRRAAAPIRGAWHDGTKATVRARFAATGLGYALAMYARVESALDDYENRWASMRVEACEATNVHRIQSAQLLDRRTVCL